MTKSYRQRCMVAKALDLVGERWTLLIVRDLLLGGRRYSDLLAGLPGLTTNLLAKRLERLTEEGLIEKRTLPPPASATVYELTELGRRLEPVVLGLGTFGEHYGRELGFAPAEGDRANPRWAMVSLKRRYRGSPRRWTVGVAIEMEDLTLPFAIGIGGETPDVRDGTPTEPDLELRGGPRAWGALLYGGAKASELVATGDLERQGPARALGDFCRAFGLSP